MIDVHDQVHAFADGELSAQQASEFRDHLATCKLCQAELHDLLQLQLLGQQLQPTQSTRESHLAARAYRPRWHRARTFGVVLSSAVAAAIVVVVVGRPGLFSSDELVLTTASTRPFEARLSYSKASAYRPYDVARSGSTRFIELIPLRVLASLEERHDFHGVGTGHLLRGEREQAEEYLAKESPSPNVKSDMAVVKFLRGEHENALALLDEVLDGAPTHPQALWNKGLVLQELGLPFLAAESFMKVAELLEPGWSREARDRATNLTRASTAQREGWDAARKAGMALALEGTPFPPELIRKFPAQALLYFYNAVRAAPTRERLELLKPLAVELDRSNGDDRLSRYTQLIGKRDFAKRGALASTYATILSGQFEMKKAADYLKQLEASGEDDILAGALAMLERTRSGLEKFERAARKTGDPWLMLFGEHERAKIEVEQGDLAAAEARLLRALDSCTQLKYGYRCAQLETTLSEIYTIEHRLADARQHAASGMNQAKLLNEWYLQSTFIQRFASIARFQHSFWLARAYLLEERLQFRGDCRTEKGVGESLAALYMKGLQTAEARKQIDSTPDCGEPLSLSTALLLADLARMDAHPDDGERALRIIEALRKSGKLRPDELIRVNHVQARVTIERNRKEGQEALRSVISQADSFPRPNTTTAQARAYSYASLILDAGKAGEYDRALSLFAEEVKAPPPINCSLGIELQDERTLVVAQGRTADATGVYKNDRKSPTFDVSTLVPETMKSLLRSCSQVDVFARTPIHGRAGLLPEDIAWSYHRGGASAAQQSSFYRLLVADVLPPPALRLPHLNPRSETESAATVELKGALATPSRVISEMSQASEIEFHAHGLVNLGVSDASFLALSPESSGKYALTAGDVRQTKLKSAPVVILAACGTAQAAPYLHEPWSLPLAFIQAGARAVIASPFDIPDLEAGQFFSAVRARIDAGASAAVAVRDERVTYLKKDANSWVKKIVVFD